MLKGQNVPEDPARDGAVSRTPSRWSTTRGGTTASPPLQGRARLAKELIEAIDDFLAFVGKHKGSRLDSAEETEMHSLGWRMNAPALALGFSRPDDPVYDTWGHQKSGHTDFPKLPVSVGPDGEFTVVFRVEIEERLYHMRDAAKAILDSEGEAKSELAARPTETPEERARAIALSVDSHYRENPARWQEQWAVAVREEEEWHTRRAATEKRREEAGQAIRREREAIQAGGNATPHLTDPETQPGEGWHWEHVRIGDPATGLPVVHVEGWMPPDTEQWSEGEWPGCNPSPSAMYLALAVLHDAALQGSPSILDSVTEQSTAVGVIVDRNFDDGAPPPRRIRECLDDLDGPFRLRCTQQGMARAQTFLNAVEEDLKATDASTAGAAQAGADGSQGGADRGNSLRLEGDRCEIVFEGQTVNVPRLLGAEYLAFLIRHQGKSFVYADIRRVGWGGTPGHGLSAANAVQEGLTIGGERDAGEVIDSVGRQQAKEALPELERQYEVETDPAKKAEIKDDIAKIKTELAKAVDLTGKPRRVADPYHRHRVAVRQAIERTLDRIKSRHLPLWQHLHNALNVTAYQSYAPSPPVDWKIEE